MLEDMRERMPDRMPEDMPHRLAESVPEDMQDRTSERSLPVKWTRLEHMDKEQQIISQIEYKIVCVEVVWIACFAGSWVKQDQVKASCLVERMMCLSSIASCVS